MIVAQQSDGIFSGPVLVMEKRAGTVVREAQDYRP